MTDNELADIKARAEAATPGPWHVEPGGSSVPGWGIVALERTPDMEADDIPYAVDVVLAEASQFEENPPYGVGRENDAEFIAHAREDIPSLLAKVEQLRAENDALREVVEGVAMLKDEFYGKTVDDVKIGGWAFATEDVTPLVEQARMLLGIDEEETDHP